MSEVEGQMAIMRLRRPSQQC